MNYNDKYELRSDKMHEVMNKPPRVMITWGNTLVLVIIVLIILIINTFKIETSNIINGNIYSVSHEKSEMQLIIDHTEQELMNTTGSIVLLNNIKLKEEDKINFRIVGIDSLKNTLRLQCIDGGCFIKLSKAQTIQIEVGKQKLGFFERMLRGL